MTSARTYFHLAFCFLVFACGQESSSYESTTSSLPSDKLQTPRTCSIDKLYGRWELIRTYEGYISSIDTLTKSSSIIYKYGTPSQTYSSDGTFISDQGDYQDKGKFSIDKRTCSIREFDHKQLRDTSHFEISYIDEEFLILTTGGENADSWFYRRK